MMPDYSYPILIPAKSAVLLIFMPLDRQRRTSIVALANSLQQQLGSRVRVLRIDEANHPDVVRSFDITATPAFVLVQQGVELWRQVGTPNEEMLTQLSQQLLNS
ncbi:thioredoxin family protein [Spirosoma jeollabukense]